MTGFLSTVFSFRLYRIPKDAFPKDPYPPGHDFFSILTVYQTKLICCIHHLIIHSFPGARFLSSAAL